VRVETQGAATIIVSFVLDIFSLMACVAHVLTSLLL
jgi:hypothetical protein